MGQLYEFLLGLLVPRVLVWMVLFGQQLVSLFDFPLFVQTPWDERLCSWMMMLLLQPFSTERERLYELNTHVFLAYSHISNSLRKTASIISTNKSDHPQVSVFVVR
jgi:hypothetical protein